MNKLLLTMLCLLTLVGCADSNHSYDVKIVERDYIDTTSSVQVNGYNGYMNVGRDAIKNEDGSYTVTLIFKNMKQK